MTMHCYRSLSLVGGLALCLMISRILCFAYVYLRYSSLPRFHHGESPWAFVTGATAGIGLELASQLAGHGFNLIIHGRDRMKLERVRAVLEERNPSAKVRIFVFDTTTIQPLESTDLPDLVDGLRITVLINNIGIAYGTVNAQEIDNELNTNLRFTLQLTHFLRSNLIACQPSLVMNMSSSGALGTPFIGVYGAAKWALLSWGKAMSAEMRGLGHDVEISGMLIGEVSTQGNPVIAGFGVPTAAEMAKMCLARVGGGRVIVPSMVHALQIMVVEAMPDLLREMLLFSVANGRKQAWRKGL